MSVRVTTHQLLVAQPALTALVPTERWFRRGGTIDTPALPYVVLAWLGSVTVGGRNSPELLDVYVHDERGSYGKIDQVLKAVKPVLLAAEQYAGPSGTSTRLVQATYLGRSADLFDPDNGTAFQYSSWRIIGGEEA